MELDREDREAGRKQERSRPDADVLVHGKLVPERAAAEPGEQAASEEPERDDVVVGHDTHGRDRPHVGEGRIDPQIENTPVAALAVVTVADLVPHEMHAQRIAFEREDVAGSAHEEHVVVDDAG